jgi:hypothetical protein
MAGQKKVNNVAKRAAKDGKISGSEAKAIQAAAAKSGGSAAVAVSNQAAKGVTVTSNAQKNTGLTIKPSGQITYNPTAVTSQLSYLDQARINNGLAPNPAPAPVNDKFVQNTAGTFSYTKPAATAASPSTAGAGSTNTNNNSGSNNSTPNNGEYDNILDLINQQREEAKQQIDFWQNKATEDANANAQQVAAIQAGAEQQAASLQQMMIGQQQAFQQQQALQQQQVAAAQAAYEEQRRQADALGRAFVPNLQPSAAAPAVGDSRSSGSSSSNSNTLSSLSILSGIGSELTASSMTPVLAGLQIA